MSDGTILTRLRTSAAYLANAITAEERGEKSISDTNVELILEEMIVIQSQRRDMSNVSRETER